MFILGILLLILGVVLLLIGLNASQTLTERFMKSFTGRFTQNTSFYILVGLVFIAIGVALLLLGYNGVAAV